MQVPTLYSFLLARWMRLNGVVLRISARELGIANLAQITAGHRLPTSEQARKIEIWTAGAVPAHWVRKVNGKV